MTATGIQHKETDIVITREFDASRQLVWDVWTQTEHVEKWFGPKGFNTRVDKLDFKVGGQSVYVMIGPDGTDYPSHGVFKEIVPIEKIVTTDEFGDGFEKIESMKNVDLPTILTQTYLFDDLGERTKLTIIVAHPTAEDKAKHEAMGVFDGWNSSLDKLAEHLATQK